MSAVPAVRRNVRRTKALAARDTISAVRHLKIAWALLRFYGRAVPGDWYRKFPFLPIPPRDYIQWRLHTAYGQRRPPLGTVVRDVWQFGDWLRTFPRAE